MVVQMVSLLGSLSGPMLASRQALGSVDLTGNKMERWTVMSLAKLKDLKKVVEMVQQMEKQKVEMKVHQMAGGTAKLWAPQRGHMTAHSWAALLAKRRSNTSGCTTNSLCPDNYRDLNSLRQILTPQSTMILLDPVQQSSTHPCERDIKTNRDHNRHLASNTAAPQHR